MSQKRSLDELDYQKIFRGFLVAIAGAVLTYSQELIPTIDFGALTPLAVAINSTLVNALRKYVVGW